MSSDTAISIRHVSKSYRVRSTSPPAPNGRRRRGKRRFAALEDVSFDVGQGEAVGLIGRNGAGKSTLLKVVGRITAPDEGEIDIYGRVGSLLEVGAGFHPELTGRENVFLNGAVLGMRRREVSRLFDEIVDFAGVAAFLDTPVKRYSSGMYVRLAFSVAAHLTSEILLVDEVLAVGDAAFQRQCLDKLSDLTGTGRTVVCVSHNMGTVASLCERTVLLDEGKVVFYGPTADAVTKYATSSGGTRLGEAPGVFDLRQRTNPYHGTGPLIQVLRILDAWGQPRDTFGMAAPFQVTLRVEGLSELPDVVFGLGISSNLGQKVLAMTTFMSPLPPGRHTQDVSEAVCIVPSLPLTPGRYWIDVAVVEARTAERLDYLERAGAFNVIPADVLGTGHQFREDEGVTFAPFEWEVR